MPGGRQDPWCEREVATADSPKSGIKKGDVLGNASVLRRAIVDKAGQRP